MSVDKNRAVIDFITTYSGISTSAIFVNFINAKDDDVQIVTDNNDVYLNRKFVDGSVMKQYTFSIVIAKSITSMAIAKDEIVGENIDDLADMQAFMDWVNEQGENQIYPDFGEQCVIEEMHTTAENPSIDGINTEVSPALALYSMEIRIDYIDYSKVLWS
jgi:hypothetical protein